MIKINLKEMKPLFKRKRDNYAGKLKRRKLIKYLRSELRSCTTHGLPYIVNTEIHWFERFFWAVSFLFCSVIIFLLLTAQYSRFIKAPIVMSVEMDYFNWNISYPAITLCPLFKVDSESLTSISNELQKHTELEMGAYLWAISAATLETIEQVDPQTPEVLPLIDSKNYAETAVNLFQKFGNSSLTTNTNWPISVEVSMTEMGMCHVINSNVAVFDNPTKWKNDDTKYVKNNIELTVHDGDFFAQIMDYADVYKVYIHSPDEVILSTTPSYTYDIEGFMFFGVQVWSTKISDELRPASLRLRKCRFIDEPMSKRYPIYSYNHCMLECRIRMILKLCGCLPHFYKPLDHERICNLAELSCVAKYKKDITTLSASTETLRRFRYSNDLPKSSRDCDCLNSCETDVYRKDRESFLTQTSMNRLRIGISSFPKVRVVRDIIFRLYDIILRSGGVVNLCIGTSIISAMELVIIAIKFPVYKLIQSIMSKLKLH